MFYLCFYLNKVLAPVIPGENSQFKSLFADYFKFCVQKTSTGSYLCGLCIYIIKMDTEDGVVVTTMQEEMIINKFFG